MFPRVTATLAPSRCQTATSDPQAPPPVTDRHDGPSTHVTRLPFLPFFPSPSSPSSLTQANPPGQVCLPSPPVKRSPHSDQLKSIQSLSSVPNLPVLSQSWSSISAVRGETHLFGSLTPAPPDYPRFRPAQVYFRARGPTPGPTPLTPSDVPTPGPVHVRPFSSALP